MQIPPGNSSSRPLKLRGYWLACHRYLAFSVGFIFVVLGLTGSLNVFRWEIDTLLHPELRAIASNRAPLPLQTITDAAQAALPGCEGKWSLQLPGNVSSMVLARCNEKRDDRWFSLAMLWVDPYTAKVASVRHFGDFFITWIYNLHWSLLMGKSGHTAVGLLGLAFMVSLGTGLYLWWPRRLSGWRKALTIKRNASQERLMFDLHKTFGLYAFPVLFLLAFSGSYLVFPEYIKPVVDRIAKLSPEPGKLESEPTDGRPAIGIDTALAIAQRLFPDGQPKMLFLPQGPQGVYQIMLRRNGTGQGISEWFNESFGGSAVTLDQYSGKVLHVKDSQQLNAGDLFLDVQWALHYGEGLGLPGRIVWCITGLVPLVLYVTGILRWLQKRRARQNRKMLNSLPSSKL